MPLHLAKQDSVVPGVAGFGTAGTVGAYREDVGEDGADVRRQPAGAQRQVEGMHSEIAHAPVLAVEASKALPVDGLLRVEVARMEEEGADFQDAAEAAAPNPTHDL